MHFIKSTIFLFLIGTAVTGCSNRRKAVLSDSVPETEKARKAEILTVFFGLDNGLPQQSRLLYRNAPGQDGMPVVFSHELDPATLEGADFEVTTKDGSKFRPEYATLLPANEAFELRTVLLIGEYGNYPANPPVSVEIVGELVSRSGANFKGQTKQVIALPEAPVLSYAEYFTLDADYPYLEEGAGCDCPKGDTKVVVKAVWAGGVRAVHTGELGAEETAAFKVTMVQGRDTVVVTPFALADAADNDNNTDLCLNETGTPIAVKVDAGIAIDPRGDKNPVTETAVVSRW